MHELSSGLAPASKIELIVATSLVALVYVLGLGIDVMEIDAAQYAEIAREMFDGGRWLELTLRNEPYLDKPPLLFWLSRLSFEAFGVSDVAYKLPSFLAFLLGLYSTFRLGSLFGGKQAGWLGALVLATCQGAFLMNLDVRTDTLLTGLVAFAFWQVAEYLDSGRFGHAILAGVGLGLGMLAKGLVALMVPGLAVAAAIAATRDWRRVRRPGWLAMAGMAALLLAPWIVGLYQQHGTEGLRYHFWSQGIGRFTSDNVFGDERGPLFFLPVLLWMFLPWTLVLGPAVAWRVRTTIRGPSTDARRRAAYLLGGFLLSFLVLSITRSKLPHYLYVLLPAASIITGGWMAETLEHGRSRLGLVRGQRLVLVALWILVALLMGWLFAPAPVALWITAGVTAIWTAWRSRAIPRFAALALPTVLTIGTANLALNAHVYPRLLAYQSTAVAGRWLAERGIPPDGLLVHRGGYHALDFYAGQVAIPARDVDREGWRIPGAQSVWIFTNRTGLEELEGAGFEPELIRQYRHFHVSRLTLPFLDPAGRDEATEPRFLLRVRALRR